MAVLPIARDSVSGQGGRKYYGHRFHRPHRRAVHHDMLQVDPTELAKAIEQPPVHLWPHAESGPDLSQSAPAATVPLDVTVPPTPSMSAARAISGCAVYLLRAGGTVRTLADSSLRHGA